MHKISFLMGKLGMERKLLMHNQVRGVYFGYFATDSNNYLKGIKNDNFDPNLIKSTDKIGKYWKKRWAKQRFTHLLEQNRLQINISFDNNIINVQDRQRILTQKSRNKKSKINNNKLTDIEINQIIKYHLETPNKSNNYIATEFTDIFNKQINHKQIKKLLTFNY